MPTTNASSTITVDPYKMFSLCKESISPRMIKDNETGRFVKDIILPNGPINETIIIKTFSATTNYRLWNLMYGKLTEKYPNSEYKKIEGKNILKIQAVKNGRGVIHFVQEIKKTNLDILYRFCENNLNKADSVITKRKFVVVNPKNKDNSASIHNSLYKQLQEVFPDTVFKSTKDGETYKIRAIINGTGSIHIVGKRGKVAKVLQPGQAYEYYFESVIMDGIQAVNEFVAKYDWPAQFRPSLTLKLKTGGNMITVSPIAGVDRVGGENKKTDIRIYRPNSSAINISLKQANFFSWSSADTKNPRFSKRVKSLLEEAINKKIVTVDDENRIIFPPNVRGLRSRVNDDDEIKYYAFGSDASDKVNYIVINAGLEAIDYDDHIIYMNGNETYRYNNPKDFARLKQDFFVVIYKRMGSNSSALHPYRDVSVRYVNRSHAYSSDIKTRESYIDI